MPKKIAIFCDGTWNDLRMKDRTNVSRLAQCVAIKSRDGFDQLAYYDVGVGVKPGISRVLDSAVSTLGGAFGRGLNQKIEAAYCFLVLNYEPGDDIYVFGFSRGAYTARSLCGLIRKCGILRREHFAQTPRAMELYRNQLHPKDPSVVEFRAHYAHPLAAGTEDYDRLGIGEEQSDEWDKEPESSFESGEYNRRRGQRAETRDELYQYRPLRSYRMMYLGVWDTVGSLGLPERFRILAALTKNKYAFHDLEASSLLSSIRHAVAVDEDRRVFNASLYDNLDDLNREWATYSNRWTVDTFSSSYVPYRHRPYQQWWFPGDHGAVGGGNPEHGLSSSALLWIAQGASDAGLDFVVTPTNELGQAFQKQNPTAEWHVDAQGNLKKAGSKDKLGWIGGYRGRQGPKSRDEAGDTAICRWLREDTYRPRTLAALKGLQTIDDYDWDARIESPPPGFPARPPGPLGADPLFNPSARPHP